MNSKKIEIKVIPNAKKEEIVDGSPLKVYVREPAEKNKANIAVLKLLTGKFNAKNARLLSGAKSRRKMVEIFFE